MPFERYGVLQIQRALQYCDTKTGTDMRNTTNRSLRWTLYGPVSYTHLDVYKRQV